MSNNPNSGCEPCPLTSMGVSSALQGVKILIVDDDLETCELLSMGLQVYEEADVMTFRSVREVLDGFSQSQPQVLISDIAMPYEDGFTLIQGVRAFPAEQGGKIPVIALSALGRDEDRQRAFEAGFDRYLTKPLDFEELISTLLDVLQETR